MGAYLIGYNQWNKTVFPLIQYLKYVQRRHININAAFKKMQPRSVRKTFK